MALPGKKIDWSAVGGRILDAVLFVNHKTFDERLNEGGHSGSSYARSGDGLADAAIAEHDRFRKHMSDVDDLRRRRSAWG